MKNMSHHQTGGTLYLRPLLIGVGDIIGVKPAEEYIFTITCYASRKLLEIQLEIRQFLDPK